MIDNDEIMINADVNAKELIDKGRRDDGPILNPIFRLYKFRLYKL